MPARQGFEASFKLVLIHHPVTQHGLNNRKRIRKRLSASAIEYRSRQRGDANTIDYLIMFFAYVMVPYLTVIVYVFVIYGTDMDKVHMAG
ncbi:hypothetical protein [Bifidobacterium olomucense]|uniref:hypothetical protein n=1 Tax=Bifidobacterium olomucense TaxID=2675324 RepID=UPI00145D367C|nr:hypothetical protein [Bifidobacterium sp. DSM 109959]